MGEGLKWLLVGLLVLNVVLVTKDVGKPRGPITPATAVAVTIVNGLLIAGVLVFWGADGG